MERLNLEQLARLVDEPPTPEERAILDANPHLQRELAALKNQTRALKNLPAVLPPPGRWNELEAKLVAAGLIDRRRGKTVVLRKWIQAAAALVLFTGGTVFGWGVASAPEPAPELQAGAGLPAPETPSFASLEEARRAVQTAERQWIRAYGEYRRLADGRSQRTPPGDAASRLAAIEALVATSRAAVEASPADVFFNGFLVSTLAERQQMLRQISREDWH